MGIKALSLTAVERYVSPLDPGYNKTCINQDEVDAWGKSKAKNKGDRPQPKFQHAEGATVWLIGTLNSIVMSMLADDLASFGAEGAMVIRNADNDVLAARIGLKGWENFTDDAGNPVPFETETLVFRGHKVEALTSELAELIPIPVLRQIGQEVKRLNSLDSVQVKNSDSASSL